MPNGKATKMARSSHGFSVKPNRYHSPPSFSTPISPLPQLIRCAHTAPRTFELLAPHKATIQPAVSAGERAYDAGETGLQLDATYERQLIELLSALCVEESGSSTFRMARREILEGSSVRCFTPRPQNLCRRLDISSTFLGAWHSRPDHDTVVGDDAA